MSCICSVTEIYEDYELKRFDFTLKTGYLKSSRGEMALGRPGVKTESSGFPRQTPSP